MLFQVVIKYSPDANPVRTPHGMNKLMAFARWMDEQTEYPDVRIVGQVYWCIEEASPAGYGVFACGRRERLLDYLAGMRRAGSVDIHEVKPLAVLLAEGEAKLEGGLKGLAEHQSLDR